METPRPRVVPLDSAPVLPVGNPQSGVAFARLITKGEHGSEVTLGVHWLQPGAEHPAWSFERNQEIYFVVKGHLRLTWDEGVLDIGPNSAVFLPQGWRYIYRNISEEAAFFIYCMYPPRA